MHALREYLAKRAERCSSSSPRAAPRRNRLLVELIACTGLRCSEAARLLVGDVVLEGVDPHVRIRGGKKRAPKVVETVPIPFGLVGMLRAFVHELAQDRPVFENQDGHALSRQRLWEIVKTGWRAVGARSVLNVHALRHWFISQVAAHPKAGPWEVARLARMRDLSTVLVYFHSRSGRELSDSLSPGSRPLRK